jgi:hypothetical protein
VALNSVYMPRFRWARVKESVGMVECKDGP